MNDVEVRDYSAPLASVTAGRLEFRRGAARVEIDAGPGDHLYRAHFEGRVPEVRVRGGTITVQYHHAGFATSFLFHGGSERAHFTLNESVSWELEFRGGVSELRADLSKMQLRSVLVRGGVSHSDLALPRPSGPLTVHVLGGVSDLAVHRPRDVATRFSVRGGVSELALDDQRLGAVGGGVRWQSPDFDQAADRYDISIRGGASNITIDALA